MMLDGPAPVSPKNCLVCDSANVSVFWEAQGMPVHCNVLCATREEALRVPRGDIALAYCGDCAFIWNVAFEPKRMQYSGAYENSLHFSKRFQEYADGLARRLIDRHELRGKRIIEIACGQGDFLRTLCRLGDNEGTGFDPSYRSDPENMEVGDRVRIRREFYSELHSHQDADFICCRHALEHIVDPVSFLRMVRTNLRQHPKAVVYFEVPNALFTIRHMGIWDLIYEHCTYFVPDSLRRCFERAGFEIVSLREEFGGQFLGITARVSQPDVPQAGNAIDSSLASQVQAFGDKYGHKVEKWLASIEELRGGGRAIVWGAGSKGVTFLNILQATDVIEYVVDVNPCKQGMYVAGTGQKIVPTKFLQEYRAAVVIVMNPIYIDEIQTMVSELGQRPVFVAA